MITIKTNIVKKHDFFASYNGATVAKGSVEFSSASEHDAAVAAIQAEVASAYGCEAREIYVGLFSYTGLYD